MTVSLIWAQASNGVIGSGGTIPWRLPEDMAMFRELTMGATVVMGRVTWESLPEQYRPLPGRRNLVLSRSADWSAAGATTVASLDAAVAAAGDDLWVIGGAAVYSGALAVADRLVVTEIDASYDGDTLAPAIGDRFTIAAREPELDWAESSSGLRYRVTTYVRCHAERRDTVEAMKAPFGRVLTAMVTPFTADGALDVAGAQRLATHLVDAGNDGLVISGTTGESPTTSDEEKDTLLRAVVEAVGDRAHVVAGVGTNDTAHTIELAQHAEKAGASGLLLVTPYYNRPPQAGLERHFRAAAEATSLPAMLYDIPARSGVPIETETIIALADHPQIVAVKDAKGSLYDSAKVLAATDLAYYSGEDALNLPLLAIGAVGVVSVIAHACTPQLVALVKAVDAGDLAEAQRVNASLLPAIHGIMTVTQGAIAAKAAVQLLGLIGQRTMRLPLVDATDEEIAVLRTDLKACGLTL